MPMPWSVNPLGGNTTDWRAGCGRSARPVRREGERSRSPYPYRVQPRHECVHFSRRAFMRSTHDSVRVRVVMVLYQTLNVAGVQVTELPLVELSHSVHQLLHGGPSLGRPGLGSETIREFSEELIHRRRRAPEDVRQHIVHFAALPSGVVRLEVEQRRDLPFRHALVEHGLLLLFYGNVHVLYFSAARARNFLRDLSIGEGFRTVQLVSL